MTHTAQADQARCRPAIEAALRDDPVVWLSSVQHDGRPHLVPVWFHWDGDRIVAFSKPHARKVDNLRDEPRVRLAPGLGDDWICSTFCIEAAPAAITEIERRLTKAEIATRRWWGKGLHGQRAFRDLPRTALRTTDRLAASTLGLPCWPGISAEALDEVVAIVLDVLRPN